MDERLKKTETAREEMLKYRHAQANESKERYLAMYNDAAKSGVAGGEKKWDTGTYKKTGNEHIFWQRRWRSSSKYDRKDLDTP